MNIVKLGLASSAAVALIAGTLPAIAYTGQELANQAKVSISDARAIALKAHPGKITDEELENEKGGSGLRYSFDIQRGAVTQEVGVDAQTGKVLENKKEGPHPDEPSKKAFVTDREMASWVGPFFLSISSTCRPHLSVQRLRLHLSSRLQFLEPNAIASLYPPTSRENGT